ncbi:GNAT family N-acetyltransferase [Ferrimonas marina]|uniref:Predicted N-acetyltransferase YhbS n=1 Tax=Ferrimonas marina TaxID=299255 RepID=A0A1M5MQ98_9GAMM|nr:GNAT family N-acetyltransferase [Ferrimonas marina]SHG78953.1 Predicted N-acetyltransferase YhbS [Ferrimonas marina]
MHSETYSTQYRDACLALFDSNVGKYFAPSERADFIEFLDNQAAQGHYLVFIESGKVVACGGVAASDDSEDATKPAHSAFCWGMVRHDLHGKGLGSELTQQRLDLVVKLGLPSQVRMETSQHTEGFYARFGFEAVEREKDGFAPGIDKVVMTMELANH